MDSGDSQEPLQTAAQPDNIGSVEHTKEKHNEHDNRA